MKKEMKKKTGLGIVMVLAILMLGSVAEAVFSGAGSGTEQDPYIITNVNQLQEMNDELDAWYELGNDIDASATSSWNGDGGTPEVFAGFIPVSVACRLDGKGYAILHLYIDRPDLDRVGLFGYIGGLPLRVVKNVGLVDVDITGRDCVGALAGKKDATIFNCYSTGSVRGHNEVGGLVGCSSGATTIDNSYSAATVNGSGNSYVGGFLGRNHHGHQTNCYSTGRVNDGVVHSGVGGFCGDGYWGGSTNCFWDTETSGQCESYGGTPKTTAEMKREATFIGWGFAYIWNIIEGLNYPYLNPRIFSGKGMWIWKVWEEDANGVVTGYKDVNTVTERLTLASIQWVVIKCGDANNLWENEPKNAVGWVSGAMPQFHDAGIKVLGWQYVYGDDPVGEANVANQILEIGVDGFIINAEGEYKGKQDNAITYLENIRIEHPDSSIAYSTFARAGSHEEFPYKEFGRYCDIAMPQTYWKDRPTTPTNEVAATHSQWSELYESWEGTEYSSSIKPIIPMGQSYSDLHGYCSGSEIIEFCDALYDYGYEKASIWRYDIMTAETWDAYTISFNEVLIAALSPVDLIVTDPDGLEISKELNEIPRATYLEYDINGDDELDDIIVIAKRKIGDYLTQVVPEPNVLPTDTYSLEVALEAATEDQTMIMAEDVQIQDIPTEPYEFESKLCYSDFDGDVDVDFVDYAIFASHWFEQDCNYPAWCEGTDLDYSGSVDINDLAIFTEHWLWPDSGTESGESGEGSEGSEGFPPDPNIIYSIVDANGNSEITIDVNESITLYIVMETNDVDIFSFNLEVNISDTNLGSIDNTEYPNGTAEILVTPRDSFFDHWGPGQEQEEGIEFFAVNLSSPMSDGNMASFVFTCEDQNDVALTLINHSQGSFPTLEGITIHQGDQMMGGEGMGIPFGIQETQQLQPVQEIDFDEIVRFLEEIWLQDDGISEMISEDEWNEFINSVKDSPAY